MLEVTLNQTTDPELSFRQDVKQKVDSLCQYLAENPGQRRKWADLLNEFRYFSEFSDSSNVTQEDREFMKVFSEAVETDRRHSNDTKYRPIKDLLIGGVPECFLYYLLDSHADSRGQAKLEVHVEIENNGDIWRSNVPERTEVRTLDVAFWDGSNGRGFECKIGKVKPHICDAVVDLLATIYEKTSGYFETVLFSFCEPADAVVNSLYQNLTATSNRNRLSIIKFIGYEHLAIFDGTTSCCGGSSQSCLPNDSAPRLTT
jgi:hypothetical protein